MCGSFWGLYESGPEISNHRRLKTGSWSHLYTTTFCLQKRAFRLTKPAISSTLRTGSLIAYYRVFQKHLPSSMLCGLYLVIYWNSSLISGDTARLWPSVPHTSVDDPRTTADDPQRRSIEARRAPREGRWPTLRWGHRERARSRSRRGLSSYMLKRRRRQCCKNLKKKL